MISGILLPVLLPMQILTITLGESGLNAKSAVAIQPGKVDRSPTGTALSARMALLQAQGKMQLGDTLKEIYAVDDLIRVEPVDD